MTNSKAIPVLILCGGSGIRLKQDAMYIPKAMVKIGQRPIVWHIMKRYALFGYTKFILALGNKGEMIRDYFLNYESYTNDIRVTLGDKTVTSLTHHQENGWEITLVDTGQEAQSGARISRCREYISGDDFMLTYSDNVATVDLDALAACHRKSKKILTITGVTPPFRELEFQMEKEEVVGHFDAAKTKQSERYMNGGFMMATKKLFSYVSSFNECRLESEVFNKLIQEKKLAIYPHHGFWRWLDTDRDNIFLNDLMNTNTPYWLNE